MIWLISAIHLLNLKLANHNRMPNNLKKNKTGTTTASSLRLYGIFFSPLQEGVKNFPSEFICHAYQPILSLISVLGKLSSGVYLSFHRDRGGVHQAQVTSEVITARSG